MAKTKIPEYIKEVENMNVFDKMLIWNHRNVCNIYSRTISKFNLEQDCWGDTKINFKDFNIPYTTTEKKMVIKNGDIKFKSVKVSKEKEIHRWYHLFKTEIFK